MYRRYFTFLTSLFLRSSEARTHTNLGWAFRGKCSIRIWVSDLLLASPQIFSGAWQSRTAYWVRLALWVSPGANKFLGTSSPAASFWSRVLFWCGLAVLSLVYFSNYLKVSSCTRTVDQILTEGDAMYVKAFDDGTIHDTETLSPTEYVGLRWLLIQPN